jgi:hypothetical protein
MDRAYRIFLDVAQVLMRHTELRFTSIHQMISEKTEEFPDRTSVGINELSLVLKQGVETGVFDSDESFYRILPILDSKIAYALMKEDDCRGLKFRDESVVVTWDYVPVSRCRDYDGTPAKWARSDGEVLQQCVWRTGETPRYTNHWSYRIGGVGRSTTIDLEKAPESHEVIAKCAQYFPEAVWTVKTSSRDLEVSYQEYTGTLDGEITLELVIQFDRSFVLIKSNGKILVQSDQSTLNYKDALKSGKDEWFKYCQKLASVISLKLEV